MKACKRVPDWIASYVSLETVKYSFQGILKPQYTLKAGLTTRYTCGYIAGQVRGVLACCPKVQDIEHLRMQN